MTYYQKSEELRINIQILSFIFLSIYDVTCTQKITKLICIINQSI